ncbi:MAG TPA: PBP1A family penicillin-binding protein, partial [Actinomycetota bacterium]|nr:PBP1A family penicillin-binding protein [Actinomycetota bacterium]
DPVAEFERLLLIVFQFLPRLAAMVRLRVAEARLGAWSVGLAELPAPAALAARERAAAAQREEAVAGAAITASRREAVQSGRLALQLAGQAVAAAATRVRRGIRSGSSMLWAWLVSLAVAGRRRLLGAAAAAGRGLRTGLARLATAVAGVGAALAGLAARIDALVARAGRPGGQQAPPRTPPDGWAPPSPRTPPDGWAPPSPGTPPDGRTLPSPATLPDGRPVDDQGETTELWWLPSNLGDPVAEDPGRGGRRRRGSHARRRERDPVVAALANGSARATTPFRVLGRRLAPGVTALADPPDHRRRGWLAFARPVAGAVVLAILAGTATALPAGKLVAATVKEASAGLPDLDELRPLSQPERTQIYDRKGRLIEVLHDEQDRIVVPLSRVDELLQQAVVAAEDARFYEHHGVDDRGILRAALANVLQRETTQGGSTITQQLIRNAYPDLRERSLARKVKEAALAAQLENELSKQEILERYLNRVYFGAGYYGVEAASRGYFTSTARDVDLAQAATLAGVIREPETANPRKHPKRAKVLRDSVLDRMVQLGMVSSADAAKAKKQKLGVKPARRVGGRYPWFVDGLRRQLLDDPRLGRTREQRLRKLYEGGLRITTTLDIAAQQAAERAVQRWQPKSGPEIALISIDPRDGAVRAVVGGDDYHANHYNVAVQGRGRQTGSSFKPFVLAAALDAGVSPDSVWESSAFQADEVCGVRLDPPWEVDNYEGKGEGKISVREATARSVNGVYARLMQHLCPQKVSAMAKNLGVRLDPAQANAPSIALGSAEVRPIDMASAYATFANMGEYHQPTFVEKIEHHGRLVFADRPPAERRISAALAWEVNDLLKGVIAHGTGTAANIGRPEAGKTGTNQAYRDAWFVGYTPQLSTAVWMGNPKKQESMLNVNGIRVTGGSYPARVWHDFMLAALAGEPAVDWTRPPDQLHYTILPPKEPDKKKERRQRRRPGPPRNG